MANLWKATPEEQAATFRHQDQIWPHRVIRRSGPVRPLPPHGRPLADPAYRVGEAMVGLDDFMARRRTAGFLVLKNGEIALERYGLGSGPQTRWASFSTAKSMTATLVGAAQHGGLIGDLDEVCDPYLPQMRGSAYAGVTLRNLLRMASGVAWDEGENTDGTDVRRLGRALASRRPGAVLELLRSLPRAAPQGTVFNYSTGDSILLGAVVAAAVGRPLADYFGETVWGPAGMEADGLWQLDAEEGLELGGTGVSARLRDVGRFGLLVLEDGVAFGGRRVLPAGWRDLAGQPDCAATGFGQLMTDSPAGYGYHWWALPGAPFAEGLHAGAFLALGAFGQRIYLSPAEQVVVVIQSAWRQAGDREAEAETVALLRTLIRALRP
ncbi:serine hydrolase domain-containing protein [Phenylobacterium aquaticum]|uniref:serine hydrolase domain-containing protein n=1 Tax=Phenylobacterium aquaticum TaxID=1763816 RepID=UPI001F5CC0C0|nr:beta-lactamase family protein [Phenylobacterium aquaticum]